MAAVLTLPAMAQQFGAQEPAAQFQSTSVMSSSGSAYSSTPMLGDDGTATYNTASYAPAQAHGGPRKVTPPTPEGTPTPVGNGVWALLMMAVGYGVVKGRKYASTERTEYTEK